MKFFILCTSILFFLSTTSFGQFSIEGGLLNPIGSFAKLENGAAKFGYQLGACYDISDGRVLGLSTGFKVAQNPVQVNSSKFTRGQWSFVLVEVGPYVELGKNFKLKSLVYSGYLGSPEYSFENGTSVLRKFIIGLDLKLEYHFKNFYVGSNFLYSNPELEFYSESPMRYSFLNTGLVIGYVF